MLITKELWTKLNPGDMIVDHVREVNQELIIVEACHAYSEETLYFKAMIIGDPGHPTWIFYRKDRYTYDD